MKKITYTRGESLHLAMPQCLQLSLLCTLALLFATPLEAQTIEATASAIQPSCEGDGTVNSDGYLQITSITNGTNVRANWSVGSTYTGDPDYASAFDLGGATFPYVFSNAMNITNPTGSQDYTIRVFDEVGCGVGDCFTDIVVTMEEQNCTVGCDCNEYIYLAEPALGAVLKFEVTPDLLLTELTQANGGTPPFEHWYPGLGTSELPSPHGIAFDLNGNLYIGSNFQVGSDIRKFRCDGTIMPTDATTINHPYILTSMFSIDNTLYTTRSGGPAAFDLCTGSSLGTTCLNDESGMPLPFINNPGNHNWGLTFNEENQLVYVTGMTQARQGIWVFTRQELEDGIADDTNSDCVDPLIWRSTSTDLASMMPGDQFLPNNISLLSGITSDNDGNIFVAGWLNDGTLQGFIIKYDSMGNFIASATPAQAIRTRGVVWSEVTGRVYIANQTDNPTVDCISAFDADDLTYLGTAAPNPGLDDNNGGKAMTLVKECCPSSSNQSIEIPICNTASPNPVFLNEQFPCEGTICEGMIWAPADAASEAIYDACSQSITPTTPGCYTFTRSSDGTGVNAQCPAFVQNLTISVTEVMASVIGGDQQICSGVDPAAFTVNSAATGSGDLNFQWYVSATSATAGYTAIAGATSEVYDPTTADIVADTMYFRNTTSVMDCTGGVCVDTSNIVVVITVVDVIVNAGADANTCRTSRVDLSGATFTPTNFMASDGTILGATWSSSTAGGTFYDATGAALTPPVRFGEAISYQFSPAELVTGSAMLTLTVDDIGAAPFNVAGCAPASDDVIITVLNVDCGAFPWNGND